MLKFLPIENAMLELDLKSLKKYLIFINNNYKNILESGITRIIFNVTDNFYQQLYEKIKPLFKDKVIIIFNVKVKSKIRIKLRDNYFIFNTNNNIIIKEKNVYNVINSNKKDKIAEYVNKKINVVINPVVNPDNISKFGNDVEYIINNTSYDLNIGGYLVPTFLLREHPCNAYLCRGVKCHKKITGLPRYIFINNKYDVYPHKIIDEHIIMGNIENISFEQLLNDYYNSTNHKYFIEISKKVFLQYLKNYPFEFFPISDFIKKELTNEK